MTQTTQIDAGTAYMHLAGGPVQLLQLSNRSGQGGDDAHAGGKVVS